MNSSLLAFFLYFSVIICIGLLASKKQSSASEYLLGGRQLNYWVTAISANASDMSSWLFMGLPMVIFLEGGIQIWTAIGLITFMFLNWHFISRRLRLETEKYDVMTLSSYFEKRFFDKSGSLRIVGAILSTIFLTTYIAAGLIGLGYLFESIFQINYFVGLTLGTLGILLYTSMGGFTAIAWTDFFQGVFLLVVYFAVPVAALFHVGGISEVVHAAETKKISLSLFGNDFSSSWPLILSTAFGWGMGYFGQPHILNKFMAVKNPNELAKSKYVSLVWQIGAFGAAIATGFVAIAYFKTQQLNPERIFIQMTMEMFHPFLSSFILCAILAATFSTIDSQILVLASTLTQDIFRGSISPHASKDRMLLVSRLCVFLIAASAFIIACFKPTTIFSLVNYCWVGLGCSFGPVLVLALYSKRVNQKGALVGMLSGGLVGAFWIVLDTSISAMIPGFITATAMALLFSRKEVNES